jgi:hypothetical protein
MSWDILAEVATTLMPVAGYRTEELAVYGIAYWMWLTGYYPGCWQWFRESGW